MPIYEHTQASFLWLGGFALASLITAAMALTSGHWAAWLAFLMVSLILVLMPTLKVSIRGDALVCQFGPGVIRRTIPMAQIAAVEQVTSRWYYGWGIRLTPHGWMWNISGLGAVELRLADGSRFRIGSDQPDALADAIRSRLSDG